MKKKIKLIITFLIIGILSLVVYALTQEDEVAIKFKDISGTIVGKINSSGDIVMQSPCYWGTDKDISNSQNIEYGLGGSDDYLPRCTYNDIAFKIDNISNTNIHELFVIYNGTWCNQGGLNTKVTSGTMSTVCYLSKWNIRNQTGHYKACLTKTGDFYTVGKMWCNTTV